MYDITEWKHVFKLDPDKEISDENLEILCESGTDAIIVGGSDNVTMDNVLNLMSRIRRYLVPCVLEVSEIESIIPGFDLYFIPSVMNSTNTKWVMGMHHEAVKEYGEIMSWDELIVEGYCILNGDCKAAKLTEANVELTADDVMAYARMAENMFHMPIFYLEYSGTYGDVNVVQAASSVLSSTKLFYGGGIETPEQAAEMAEYADVVVIGNVIYDDFGSALKTVKAVKP
ncbi:heptaprenylglyceryl phosphate synthase [Metabacillus idriensis]|uniref:Heptaprenylglyceryl phosphate synthase n=1 Tax=Metabacillus idriensis TaxID=324768 RepID=A0A6I2MD25_9BACI|nr:heptaprenylglyceryl phosphate synthase [Metabacillus idriensis]MCM3598193.1 heptaprenylglyceryl phosphate synthase [Metabacillus idriensis]MRX55182.1 heptaprenylglyceryl phosphate synthase [Metabacillus idriensis]OHR71749.1 geranylgeranylglyceryl/heptaprenylglyceryl phosphate synthase [Bacillus sp. HMSC76G11]